MPRMHINNYCLCASLLYTQFTGHIMHQAQSSYTNFSFKISEFSTCFISGTKLVPPLFLVFLKRMTLTWSQCTWKFDKNLYLPVNALAQNMFSCDVKHLSFRCRTFKFPRPNAKFYFSRLLKGKKILINNRGRNHQKGVPLSTICRMKWKNLSRIILSQKLGKD